MRCIEVLEGDDFALSRSDAERLRAAAERLKTKLRPSFSLLSERSGLFRLTNVVGTVDLGSGTVIQVSPKVAASTSWKNAVVALLTGAEEVDLAGERRAGTSPNHNNLLDSIAAVYLGRLQRAFRQEGAIVLMERKASELPYLQGSLDVSKWARKALWQPHVFPVARTELAQDNPFTRGLVTVAQHLAMACSDRRVREGLISLKRDLAGGVVTANINPADLIGKTLPEQWSAYRSAWSLALAVVSKTSLLGPTGRHTGVGLAVEAWPLLETLLKRSLKNIERLGRARGRALNFRVQGNTQLLRPLSGMNKSFSPAPDGRLFEGGRTVATFEAKYTPYDGLLPQREHIYQALATAAASGATTSVLVYPEHFSPQVWQVQGFMGKPTRLIAIGLDLYRWMSKAQVLSRDERILDLIDSLGVSEEATTLDLNA